MLLVPTSSASVNGLDRFLMDSTHTPVFNVNVVDVSSPAQYFHVLRRQMKRPFRKPLVVRVGDPVRDIAYKPRDVAVSNYLERSFIIVGS